jgi:sphinganine-1-phosphate aldolase
MPEGVPADAVLAELAAMTEGDADWRGGRTFSLVYNADDDELTHLHDEVGRRFLAENALNPFAFPSLGRMEHEVVDVAKGLVHLAGGGGTMSAGGTESIFLAVHTAREWARDRGVEQPVIVTARTAHPAFAKACHYLGVEQRRVGLRGDLRADPAAMVEAIDDRVALLVASAPCYPYGVVDPVPQIAGLAAERELLCHVDACLGGWLLPFWEQLGGCRA